ncbi:MAG: hypothetical protein QM762_14090 [Chryseolinea sp.]
MTRRAFFTLFPKGYWILTIVGVVLSFTEVLFEVGGLLFAIGFMLLSTRIAVIIHETGHLLAAKIAGGVPRRMVLGTGHELHRSKYFTIPIIVNSNFRGGMAYASFHNQEFIKLRYAFYILGGALLNFLVALTLYFTFDTDPELLGYNISAIIPFCIFAANAVIILIALLPYNSKMLGYRKPTDGLSLLQLPFKKQEEVLSLLDTNLIFDAQEYLETKNYQAAIDAYAECLKRYPEKRAYSLSLAIAWLKTGYPEKCIGICNELLADIEDRQLAPYAGVIYNALAWTYLVLNKIDEADHFSALAIKLIPGDDSICGTRGSVLVERGKYDEGTLLLYHSVDLTIANSATVSSALYMMLAYHKTANSKEAAKYRTFVEKNADKLDLDEKVLYERCLSLADLNMQSNAIGR